MPRAAVCVAMMLAMVGSVRLAAAQQGSVRGVVTDPLGARVAGAAVSLIGDRPQPVETTSDASGAYRFTDIVPGRYQVVAMAPGFERSTTGSVYVGADAASVVNVTLQVGSISQAVVVTAAASEVSQAQTGAPITVIDSQLLDTLNKPDVLEALRLVPGAQIVQTGARGSKTSMFIRGGESTFNKVLIDGVPANDIGGGFDFAQVSTIGVEQVEVLRQTNSVMYGSDALAGVINITTRRGRTRIPELTVAADGGNLGTWSSAASLGGVVKRLDYFSAYSRFDTDNKLPNNQYRNGTYAGRFGVAFGHGTDLSATIRRIDADAGNAGAFPLYGISNDSRQDSKATYVGIAARSQVSRRWQAVVRFGSSDQTFRFADPRPTGEPYDPFGFGANYLGNLVTVTGHNGFSATGRAILDFGGQYPSLFESHTTKRTMSGSTTFDITDALSLSAGARYEREEGTMSGTSFAPTMASRNNGGAFVEGRLALFNRAYVNAGIGVEHNEVFGEAVTPRISVAAYLRQPPSGSGETKIVLNAGTGIKAPSISQAQSSLYELVRNLPIGASVDPIGPERSRSFDIGIEQGFAGNRAQLRVAYFDNTFRDLLEFLSKTTLPLVGVPVDAANATNFGAYVNSQSNRAQGAEIAFQARLHGLRMQASYTRLASEVTRAFSATASFNPAFPTIPIGAYSALVGERPFRRPTNSGTLMVAYAKGRGDVAMSAYFAGARDDSTFLTDQDFGNSLLLPNRDLDAPYQKVDLSGAWVVRDGLRIYSSIENLLNQAYEPAFGYPALPLTVRFGAKVTFGGDRASRP